MAKILLAEDDRDLSEVITFGLRTKGHAIQQVFDGPSCADYLNTSSFDLIILDWMMPGRSGIDLCRDFRSRGGKTPILMLTAKTMVEDREQGLDSGADDYLTKPFDQRELAARVRALLRRPDSIQGNQIKIGRLELDTVGNLVRLDGEELHLRPKEYSLLEFFMRHPDQAFSTDAILRRVWLDEGAGTPDNLKTHIKMLRRKIDLPGAESVIRTVTGKGYMFKGSDDPAN